MWVLVSSGFPPDYQDFEFVDSRREPVCRASCREGQYPTLSPRQQRSYAAARNTPINLHHIEAQSLKNQSTSTEMETQGRQAYPMTLTQFILEEQHHHPTAQVRRLFLLNT
jgi:hypothetical protein